MSAQRDALVQNISKAATLGDQVAAVRALHEFDANRVQAAAVDREIDLANTTVTATLSPGRVHEMHTASTDWLMDVESTSSEQARQASIAEAALWFGRTSSYVKADPEEFGIQAEGFMRREASKHGEHAPDVYQTGLDYIGFLWRREAASGLDQIQQTVNPHEDPKATPLPPQVFDNFAPDVHPINGPVVGTETSERAPLLQEVLSEGSGSGSPEVPGGHSTTNAPGAYSEVPAGGPADNSSGPLGFADGTDKQASRDFFSGWGSRSVAINHTMTLADFLQAEAASGLDQVQQVVDPHEDPKPTALPTDVQFPWLIGPDAYGNGGEQKEAVHKQAADRGPSYNPDALDSLDLHSPGYNRAFQYTEGYDHGLAGQERFGYGSRDKAMAYGLGYQHGQADRGKQASRKQADMFGNSDTPHQVPGVGVANNPGTTPNAGAAYAEGQADAAAGDHPTYSDASSAVPANVKQYSQGYSDEVRKDHGSPAKDFDVPASMGGDNGTGSLSAAAKVSDRFVKAASRENPDFRKGYGFASRWTPGKPLVTTGSAEFESGIFAGIADNPTHREAWTAAHRRQASKNQAFAQRLEIHADYTGHLADQGISLEAATSTDLDTMDPTASPSPTGTTPINGPGTTPPLAGQEDPAAPGGPAPYNGAEPFGAPAVPTGAPAPQAGPAYVNDIPGGPLDGNAKALAFRRRVQASLLTSSKQEG